MPPLAPRARATSKEQRLQNVLSVFSLLLWAVLVAWWWGSYQRGPISPRWDVPDRQIATLSFRGQIILLTQRRAHATPEYSHTIAREL